MDFYLIKENIKKCKNISKNVRGTYSQKFLEYATQSVTAT